jgi:catechol 2,3-dioxygenase-like lactoylglutathione lyase family enzyme
MPDPNFVILYVADPRRSVAFWSEILGHPPIEVADTFAMLAMTDGVMLGLWSHQTLAPAASAGPGGSELAITVATPAAVDETHAAWAAKGVPVLLPPTDLDFGRSFVVADPDGHRLRVMALAD